MKKDLLNRRTPVALRAYEVAKLIEGCRGVYGANPCEECPLHGEIPCIAKLLEVSEKTLKEMAREVEVLRGRCDAAIYDLRNAGTCGVCVHLKVNGGNCSGMNRCLVERAKASAAGRAYEGPDFTWRGVCERNSLEDGSWAGQRRGGE